MNAALFSVLTLTLVYSSLSHACSPYPAEQQIGDSKSIERLLLKISEKVSAECGLMIKEDEYSYDVRVAYRDSDEDLREGKITRNFKAPVECKRASGEIIDGMVKGKVTVKFWEDAFDGDSCDGQIHEKIMKLSSSIRI